MQSRWTIMYELERPLTKTISNLLKKSTPGTQKTKLMTALNFNPKKYSSLPETFRVERIFDKTPEQIWPELVNHRGMIEWMPGISDVQITHNDEGTEGLGCKRVCQFGPETLNEEIVWWEENKAYGYKIADNNLIENHVAYVTIEALSNGKSKVSWIQHLQPKGNFIKRLLMKKIMLPRTLKKGLKNLEQRIAA